MPRTSPLIDSIAQLELRVGDLAEARRFYEDVLGLRVESSFGQTLMLSCGAITLLVQESKTRPQGCPIYFNVDNRVHEVATQLKANGIRFKSGPTCIVENFGGKSSWLAFFEDPWGNPLALTGDMPAA